MTVPIIVIVIRELFKEVSWFSAHPGVSDDKEIISFFHLWNNYYRELESLLS